MQIATLETSLKNLEPFNLFTFSKTGKPPDIFLASDIDHSLIPWEKGKYKVSVEEDTLYKNYEAIKPYKDRLLTALVTGLDLPSVQLMRKYFDSSLQVHFLSTDNGKGGLYINQDEIETTNWLEQLKIEDRNIEWETFVKEIAGWEQDLFLKSVFNELLIKRGYKELKDKKLEMSYPHYSVYELNDGQNFNLPLTLIFGLHESALYLMKHSISTTDELKKHGVELAESICKTYNESSNLRIKFTITEHDNYFYIFFSPDNGIEINKAKACDFLIRRLPNEISSNLKAGIVIGDSGNDTHLKIEHIELQNGRKIPFYAIFSGTDLLNNEEFTKHPRIEVSQKLGNIGSSIRTVIARIDSSKQ